MKPKSCFVIMPFNDTFKEVYTVHLKPLIENQLESVECVRIDEKPNLNCSIVTNIKKEISRCTFAIADITGLNPNVFYEIGLAHALKKKVILIKNKCIGKLPFDISHLPVIVYDRNAGYSGLQNIIKQTIANNIKNVKIIDSTESFRSEVTDNICGTWYGSYKIKKHKYDVFLTISIPKEQQKTSPDTPYKCDCTIFIDDKYQISQALQYHGILNEKSNSPKEWENSEWIEFIGSAWTNISDNKLPEYLLNAYGINKKIENDCLEVKIWDNVNKRIPVYFKKAKTTHSK